MFNMKLSCAEWPSSGGHHDEPDLQTPKLIEQRHAMANASRQPVEAVNENLIDDAAAHEREQSGQPRTVERRSGVTVVIEALLQ